ncbi:LacI family DNA-binding transcriptional regulator [Streptomyces brevispora]|uniref:LacI family DNA-binding transcriptional regulator n=1 Tax=Streptomyces brevispora TaxID=887462 RepID=UPI0037FDBE4F
MTQDGRRKPAVTGRTRAPSMADVAALAGVSAQTVSRVANNRTNVDDTTRERVLNAMRMTGYRPNTAARALATGRFRTIGVISFDLQAHGNARTLESIVSAVQHSDYSVSIVTVQNQTEQAVREAFERLTTQAVDGIILNEAQILDTPALRLPPGLPVVVNDGDGTHRYAAVHTDQAEGARLAVRHLLDLGHRTVWHLAGPQDSYPARGRASAWHQILKEADCPVPPALYGDWTADSGYRVGREIAHRPDIGAVFVANDQMALGLIRALHEAGRRVPDDVSVVGFDNIAESAHFLPPLTTIHQDFEEIGRHAVAMLLDQIQAGRPPQVAVTSVAPRLIVRDSTAPPNNSSSQQGRCTTLHT